MSSHNHQTCQDHQHIGTESASAIKRLLWALGIILFFSLVEVVGGWWANSLALLSDAGHMATDAIALALAAFSAWLANQPARKQMSYGFGRAEILGALFSNMMLIILIITLSIFAIHRLVIGTPPISGSILTSIALIGLIANIIAAVILHGGEHNLNTRSALLHVLSDMLGSVVAIIAGIVIIFFHWPQIDAILSLFISALVLFASLQLLKETTHILMEGAPKNLKLNDIKEIILNINGIEAVHDLHVWNLSSKKVMLTAHVKICRSDEWPAQLLAITQTLKSECGITHITIQPELDEDCHMPTHIRCD